MDLTESADGHEDESHQDIKREAPSQDKQQQKDKSKKPRYRASIACVACRDRRIRCVVTPGQNKCTRCRESGGDCIIRDDDERRRPISRAYMCSLTDRIELLESMLRERGIDLPPANHPPKSRHDVPDKINTSLNHTNTEIQTSNRDNHSPASQSILDDDSDSNIHGFKKIPPLETNSVGSSPVLSFSRNGSMVNRLLSTRPYFSFDKQNHPLRFFGPSNNRHVYAEVGNFPTPTIPTPRIAVDANTIIAALPIETHDYLMDLFWHCYNPFIQLLDRNTFLEGRNKGDSQLYSPFLHVCMLAIGFRFANKDEADIKRISLPRMESTLHREARQLLSQGLDQLSGIPSVIALLLLSDLECGVGRDDSGWMYSGMAIRLAFDIGLHHDARLSGFPEHEIKIRKTALKACMIYDRHWALLLGRPPSLKVSDIESSYLYNGTSSEDTNDSAGSEKSLATLLREAHFALMELAGKTAGILAANSTTDPNQYLQMATLDKDLNKWYTQLPQQLCWTSENIVTAPYPFFMLHQQYHSTLILLHRSFANQEDYGNGNVENSHLAKLSRIACTRNAVKVAQIYWQHRQRFDTKMISISGVQHATVAAIALLADIVSQENPNDRQSHIQYLDCLSAALKDMSATYQPAEHMSNVLRVVMADVCADTSTFNRAILFEPTSTIAPARRNSSFEPSRSESVYKRRRQLDNENSQTRSVSQRKRSDTGESSSFVTQKFARTNSRPRGRSRDTRRNHPILTVSTPAAHETNTNMSMSPSDFSKPLYARPSPGVNVVDTPSPYEMWGPGDMQMRASFDPQYATTPPPGMQFANAVAHPGGGAGLASLSLESGGWDARNQWYMRTGDMQPVDNLQGYMWEGGAETDYNHGMGNPGV